MNSRMSVGLIVAIVGLALGSSPASAAASAGGLPPWQFEMTPKQVASFSEYGPYKSFRNGDLETYSGVFNGHKENVQFFFKDGKLARIGIYLYEGSNIKEASEVWGRAYGELRSMFGEISLPDVRVSSNTGSLAPEVVAAASGANVDATGKTQMAPVKQPSDKIVFASFMRGNVQGQLVYVVIIYYDAPRG